MLYKSYRQQNVGQQVCSTSLGERERERNVLNHLVPVSYKSPGALRYHWKMKTSTCTLILSSYYLSNL